MFRCDRRCDGKFGKFVGTKHTPCGLVKIIVSNWVEDNTMNEAVADMTVGTY